MTEKSPARAPTAPRSARADRLILIGLLLWAAALIGFGVDYAVAGRPWSWVMIATGVLTGVVVWRARGRGAMHALYLALFPLAIGMLLAGWVTGLDIYIAGGILSLTVLVVGAKLEHEIRALAEARAAA